MDGMDFNYTNETELETFHLHSTYILAWHLHLHKMIIMM